MPLVCGIVTASTKNVVQRSLRRALLEQPLVDTGAARRQTARPLSLYALRPQAAAAFTPKI
jgi:hypothetical protein